MTFIERFKKAKKTDVVLIILNPENRDEVTKQIMIEMVKTRNQNGVYITLNHPCQEVIKELTNAGVDTKKVFIIDAADSKNIEGKNHVHIENPSCLTDISIAVSDCLDSGKFQFVYVDSAPTLMVYNEERIAERFLHYLTGKIRLFGVTGIITCPTKEIKKIEGLMSQFCDLTISLGES